MLRKIHPVKALSFLIVLVLITGILSYTGAAADAVTVPVAPTTPIAPAPALTHLGQPVENFITLELRTSVGSYYRVPQNPMDALPDESFIVPLGYNLVITDIYFNFTERNPYGYNAATLFVQDAKGRGRLTSVYYRNPQVLDYGSGRECTEVIDHFTSGIVVGPGCKIASTSSANSSCLRGYLIGSAPVRVPDPSQVGAAPVAGPPASQSNIGLNPANTAPSANLQDDPWDSSWITSNESFGVMELTQSGSSVLGTIGNGKYLVSGTVAGRELTAAWQEPETDFKGTLKLTLSEDGKSFKGTWNSSKSPTWQALHGTKQ